MHAEPFLLALRLWIVLDHVEAAGCYFGCLLCGGGVMEGADGCELPHPGVALGLGRLVAYSPATGVLPVLGEGSGGSSGQLCWLRS
jgi:hypothetical protein